MNEHKDSFLGTGWGFPPQFPDQGADIIMVSNAEDIRQSLQILLQTAKYERLMHPDYYCDLAQYLFQSANYQNMSRLKQSIALAILNHEPRVDVTRIDINPSTTVLGLLMIQVNYQVRATNSRQNVVFPFYLHEGTALQTGLEGT